MRTLIGVLLIISFNIRAKAQTLEIERSGSAETKSISYRTENIDYLLRSDYSFDINYGRFGLVIQPRLEVSSFRTHGAISDWTEKSHRWVLNARELYARLDISIIDIRVGKQIIKPSIINGRIRPAQWTPMDYLDPLHPERIGIPALHLGLFGGTVEGWYAPAETASRMPETPWRPSVLSAVSVTRSMITTNVGYGARLHFRLRKTELGMGFQHGQDFAPLSKVLSTGPQSQLFFVHNPVDQAYVQLSTPISDFIFETEAALVHETLPNSNRTYASYVLSIRRQWQVGLFGDTITGSLQYVGEFGDTLANSKRLFDFRRNMKRTVFGQIKYRRKDLTYQLTSALTARDGGGYLLQPKLAYDWERWRLAAGVGLIGGNHRTFWGNFAENDFARLSLRITL